MSKKTVFAWLTLLAWIFLLTFLSSEDGLATAKTSDRIVSLLMRIFTIPAIYRSSLESTLRMVAHFICFFGLGILMIVAFRAAWGRMRAMIWRVMGICAVMGIMDEVKKVFIIGRHLSWPEAGLNVVSAWFGIVVMVLIFHWYTKDRNRSFDPKVSQAELTK